MWNMNVSGTHTAIITPFRKWEVDYEALSKLVEQQVAGNVVGIVSVGTTWESPTLMHDEHLSVIQKTVEYAGGKCLVIWGTGSNSTKEAIDYTCGAEELWADWALIVAPYYNKPTQQWVFLHYREIAQHTKLPIILYSIQWRCWIEINIDTVLRLARECPNIIAIKEAWWDVNKVRNMRVALDNAGLQDFQILSGDDGLTLPFMSVGATWVISVASNIIPNEISSMVQLMNDGDVRSAKAVALRYNQLFNDLFIESNPVPIKTALAAMYPDTFTSDVRSPLCELSETSKKQLFAATGQVWLT